MHVQIVTFQIEGITDEEYRQGCATEAPAWADIPGLISKVWLADQAAGTYGGVYTWRSRSDYEAYVESDLFQAMKSDATIAGFRSQDFEVLEAPTAITHGLVDASPT